MSKINKTPIETRLAIERRSAAMLPDRPTQAGLKPWDIRNALFSAIISDKGACLMGEIDRIVDEANAAIDALEEKITTAGTVTIPISEWADATPTIASVAVSGVDLGSIILMLPADEETRLTASNAKLSAYPAAFMPVDGNSSVTILRAEAEIAPDADMTFAYIIIKTGFAFTSPFAAIVGVDAYGEGGGGSGSGVDETAVKKIINSLLGNVANERQYSAANPPPYPVTSVNSKKGTVNLTASDVAARPDTWTPTAEEVGARPSTWTPTAEEVGARPNTWTPTAADVKDHNEDGGSHVDIRLDVTTLRTMLETVIGTDTGKSMRAVAALVVAEIVGDASDSFDTLEEIAAWIEAHPNDVAAMVKRITDLETAMGGKVSKTDIINTLDSTALDKPLSAAMGAKLNAMLSEMSGKLDGKTTPEQVAKAISDALAGYALKDHNHDGVYAKPADIPTKVSQLTEDSTHRTVTDAEKTGWNSKAAGDHNHDGVYQPVGNYLTQHQSLDHLLPKNQGAANAGKLMMVAADGSVTYIEIADLGLSGGDVVGNIDSDNNIVLTGDLVPGTYTFAYEVRKSDGTTETVTIGTYTVEDESETKTYTITWANYDGTVLETYTVTEGTVPTYDGATPTRAADSQYTYTFTGWTPDVVAAVADATYTAVYEQTAVEPEPAEPKNYVVYDENNTTAGDTTIWTNQARVNSSGAVVADTSTTYGVAVVSNFITVQNGDTVYYEGFYTSGKSSWLGDTNNNPVKYGALSVIQTSGHIKDLTESTAGDRSGQFTINNDTVRCLRLGGFVRDTDTPVIKIMRGGEWLTGEEETA